MGEGKHYVIWGSAGHAKVLFEGIRRGGGSVVALFDNNPDAQSAIAGVPLVGGISDLPEWLNRRPKDATLYGLVAVGGARGRDRLETQALLSEHEIQIEPFIHPMSFVATGAELGRGTQVLAMSTVAADSRLAAACIVNHNASIDHECRLGDGVHIAPGATLCGSVTVGAYSMIGAGAVVLPRSHVGRNSIVGAGAVVTKDVPDGVVVTGNPATIVRRRKAKTT